MEKIINNLKIEYVDRGDGDTLCVFLHGWGACKENFNASMELLKDKYRCVALDLPGFGESEKLKKSFSVDDYADIVIQFINEILNDDKRDVNKNRQVILIGHSYGGRIMIKINNKSDLPFTIKKNIFIDSAGIKHDPSIEQKIKVATFKGMKNLINIIPVTKEEKEKRLDDLKSKFGSSDYKNADPIMRETLVKAVNEDLTPLLSHIKVDTLLIWGENDTATPLSDGKTFEKEIENSGLVVLKNTGHFSFIEDQYTYLRVMESYLLK